MMYPSSYQPGAAAHVTGDSGAPGLNGTVHFRPHRGGVLVTAQITGLPADNPGGFFALHIHEGGGCGGRMFADTGGHYNPVGASHPRHAGDLPPLLSCQGSAFLSVLTDRFTIEDVIGRTVVIHNGPDDFTSQPAGNAGTKIACGVIYRT